MHNERKSAYFIFELPHAWLFLASSCFLYNNNPVVLHSSHFVYPLNMRCVCARSFISLKFFLRCGNSYNGDAFVISDVCGLSPLRSPFSLTFCLRSHLLLQHLHLKYRQALVNQLMRSSALELALSAR